MIPRTMLVVTEPFGARLSAALVGEAIGHGLKAGDPSLDVDLCPLDRPDARGHRPSSGNGEAGPRDSDPAELRANLNTLNFDARMRRSRAVVIAAARLDRHTLMQGGAVFEIATRARQGGVPAYAIAGHDGLDLFETRILDLQVVLEAGGKHELIAAAKKLAAIAA